MFKHVEEKGKQFVDGKITVEELRATIEPWVSKILSSRGYSEKWGSRKQRVAEYILEKIVAFLKTPEARNISDLYGKLFSIMIENARIQSTIIPLDQEPIDENESEDKWLETIEPSRDPSELTHDEVAQLFSEWRNLENEVMRRQGGLWDYLKLLSRDDELWQMAAAFGSKHLDAFALTVYRLAGKRVYFPVQKKFEDARVRAALRQFMDYRGTTYEDLTRRLSEKLRLNLSQRKVERLFRAEKKRRPVDPNKQNKERDFLLRNFGYVLMKKQQR